MITRRYLRSSYYLPLYAKQRQEREKCQALWWKTKNNSPRSKNKSRTFGYVFLYVSHAFPYVDRMRRVAAFLGFFFLLFFLNNPFKDSYFRATSQSSKMLRTTKKMTTRTRTMTRTREVIFFTFSFFFFCI